MGFKVLYVFTVSVCRRTTIELLFIEKGFLGATLSLYYCFILFWFYLLTANKKKSNLIGFTSMNLFACIFVKLVNLFEGSILR